MSSFHHSFPPLEGTDLHGNIKVWNARVYIDSAEIDGTNTSVAKSEITYGRKNGKMQTAVVCYTSGKNIGRSNETTPYQQCFLETERKWKDYKEKKNYSIVSSVVSAAEMTDVITDTTATDTAVAATVDIAPEPDSVPQPKPLILPMLAKTWIPPITNVKPKKTDIVFPCFTQPKLDGVRCLAQLKHTTNRIQCKSRTGGEFVELDHIVAETLPLLTAHPSWVLDGELYTRDIPFEELVGLIKRKTRTALQQEQIKKIQYHVYDIVDLDNLTAPFQERYEWLLSLSLTTPSVVQVPTLHALNSADVFEQFGQFIEEGHEGIMLRNATGPYIPNHRSFHLQKYKEFMEEEYPIVGFTSGVGKFQGCVTWICSYSGNTTNNPSNKDDGNNTFQVVPKGTIEQKREWFENGASYIGKQLTVIFQQKMESGCPRFPVGKAVRDGY